MREQIQGGDAQADEPTVSRMPTSSLDMASSARTIAEPEVDVGQPALALAGNEGGHIVPRDSFIERLRGGQVRRSARDRVQVLIGRLLQPARDEAELLLAFELWTLEERFNLCEECPRSRPVGFSRDQEVLEEPPLDSRGRGRVGHELGLFQVRFGTLAIIQAERARGEAELEPHARPGPGEGRPVPEARLREWR